MEIWLLYVLRALLFLSLFARNDALEKLLRKKDPHQSVSVSKRRSKAERLQRLRNHVTAPYHPEVRVLLDQYHQQDPIPVDYGGRHPFERRRGLDDNSRLGPVQDVEYGNRDEMAPIRIRFVTEILEEQLGAATDEANVAKGDAILNKVLPAIQEEWSSHLSVFQASGALAVNSETCLGNYERIPLLQSFLETGISDADIALIAQATVCDQGLLAFAGPCNRDQFDRPTFGIVSFCTNADFDPTDDDDVFDLSLVAIHEIAHALGFLSQLTPYFRDATGEPLTPRTASGGVASRTVPCVNGTDQNIPFANENTLKAFITTPGISGKERLHYEVVTPKVRAVARNLFDCQSLSGARFENRPTLPDCAGNHWDERFFYSELLSPLLNPSGDGQGAVLSPLTLAFFEDSGWYRASYENVGLAGYGLGLGCDFVERDCIVNDQVPEYGEGIFCSTPYNPNPDAANPQYCDATHTSFRYCGLIDRRFLNNFTPDDPILYFSDPNLITVANRQYDFCPLPLLDDSFVPDQLGSLDLVDCTDEMTDAGNSVFEDETYGANSRCVNTAIPGFAARPACLPIVCDSENSQVIVGGRVCEFDGQMHTISLLPAFQGVPESTFVCPRLSLVCPDLFGCPGACSGRGVCNYSVTPPRCECFNSADIDSSSPLCAAAAVQLPTPPSDQPSTSGSSTPTAQPSTSGSSTPTEQPSTSANNTAGSSTPTEQPSTSGSSPPTAQPSTTVSSTPTDRPSTSGSSTPTERPSTSASSTTPTGPPTTPGSSTPTEAFTSPRSSAPTESPTPSGSRAVAALSLNTVVFLFLVNIWVR